MFASEYQIAPCGCGAEAKLEPHWWHKDSTWARVGCTECSCQTLVEHRWDTVPTLRRVTDATCKAVDDWNRAMRRGTTYPRYTP